MDDEETCAVENCATVLGAPHDRDGFCATCATEIESMEREERERSGDGE